MPLLALTALLLAPPTVLASTPTVASLPPGPVAPTGGAAAARDLKGAGSEPILPLSQVRAGMTGYGLTVFRGTVPERFNVRVIGVLHNFLPQQDIILIDSDDARLQHSGIAAGMSGSPIYLNGKLAGALAYGWSFAKDALAGVTPIENIIDEVRRPLRGRQPVHMMANNAGDAASGSYVEALPRKQQLSAMLAPGQAGEPSRAEPGGSGLSRLLPPALATGNDPRLVRAAVPLSVSGLSERAIDGLREALSPYHMTPLQAGGGAPPELGAGKGPPGSDRFVPGGAIAVQLVRGDVNMAATGTVTYLEGNKVAAFGHPMFNAGEVYLPIATAEVVTFMAALSQSFKMSTPLRPLGALTQDRQACIVGDTTQKSSLIPLQVTVRSAGQPDRLMRTEVASHRFLTPLLTSSVLTSAAQAAAPDVADAVIQIQSQLAVQGFNPLVQTDYMYTSDGVTPKSVLTSTGVRQVHDLLFNPFGPTRIEGLNMLIQVDYRADIAEVTGLSLASDELEPDTRPSLYVTLRPYSGTPYVRAIPLEVPRHLAGQTLKIEVSAGQLVRPEIAPPESLNDLVDNMRKGYSARSLVVTITTPDEGVTLRGRMLPSLPASVIATLRPGASTRRGDPYKRLNRFVVDMGTVVQGKQELTVQVKDDLR